LHKLIKEGLTFDDVLVLPKYSDILPQDVDTKTRLTKDIILNSPIISASMDTVTESRTAIAMARQGGIGFVHCNMSIENQATEVDKVKRSEHGVITDPFSLTQNHYVYEADQLMERYHISGVPIVENQKLIGIITNRDLRFETNHKKKIYEVMTKDDLITAREGISLSDAQKILSEHKIEKLPLVDENYILKGLITIKDIEKSIKYPSASKDCHGRLIVGAAVSLSDDMIERIEALRDVKVDIICLDTSFGYSKIVIDAVKKIKSKFPDLPLLAGNVVTKEGVLDLIDAGADAIKVGFGSGSIATSRIISGVGIPQISAIYECAEAARKFNIPIVSDGGIHFSGDITKAIVAGANAVMIGELFAGTSESPGETEFFKGRKYKPYRGMSSGNTYGKNGYENNYNKHLGQISPEGVEGRVIFKGTVKEVIYHLVSGLKAGMSYSGAKTIDELIDGGRFIKISRASYEESHPHDILITSETSNYSIDF